MYFRIDPLQTHGHTMITGRTPSVACRFIFHYIATHFFFCLPATTPRLPFFFAEKVLNLWSTTEATTVSVRFSRVFSRADRYPIFDNPMGQRIAACKPGCIVLHENIISRRLSIRRILSNSTI